MQSRFSSAALAAGVTLILGFMVLGISFSVEGVVPTLEVSESHKIIGLLIGAGLVFLLNTSVRK